MKITIKLGKNKGVKSLEIRPEWLHQLPALAVMCSQAQDDFNALEAVQDALEILTVCEEVTANDETP